MSPGILIPRSDALEAWVGSPGQGLGAAGPTEGTAEKGDIGHGRRRDGAGQGLSSGELEEDRCCIRHGTECL